MELAKLLRKLRGLGEGIPEIVGIELIFAATVAAEEARAALEGDAVRRTETAGSAQHRDTVSITLVLTPIRRGSTRSGACFQPQDCSNQDLPSDCVAASTAAFSFSPASAATV
jgi:hypothetical protein